MSVGFEVGVGEGAVELDRRVSLLVEAIAKEVEALGRSAFVRLVRANEDILDIAMLFAKKYGEDARDDVVESKDASRK